MSNILGVMTGSSKDGMDLSLCAFKGMDPLTWKVLQHWSVAYDEEVISALQVGPQDTLYTILKKQDAFTKWMAKVILHLDNKYSMDVISLHGHTVTHLPQEGFTFQMGSGASLYALTEIPVVSDFRQQDVSLGGQGTPMAPLADLVLFKDHDLFLNLGGIANVSIRQDQDIIGYDIAPCNQVFDHFALTLGAPYDREGKWASEGFLNESLLMFIQEQEYFKLSHPKSLDNNFIKDNFIPKLSNIEPSPKNVLHTYAHFLTRLIAKEFKNTLAVKKKVLVSGGGIRNTFFKNLLEHALKVEGLSISIPADDIIEFKESILMALLAYYRLNNRDNLLASVTGASRNSMGGALYGSVNI